jgi:hypothetical protein
MRSSHALDRLEVSFDDDHAVASAGLLLPATLAARLGIEALVNEMVELGDGPGAANPGRKVMTLIHSMVAGGDCIDDADVLRVGSTAAVLGHRVMAPSTLGTFLRAFTFGHVRQLDRLGEAVLTGAWAAGAGPGEGPLTVDVDSTIAQVHGPTKQGAAYGYTRTLGYHPCWPPGPTPARCSTPGCARARPTPAGAPSASSTSSSLAYAGRGPPGR